MCNNTPRPKLWKAWLTLLRPPNLFTVPGDPLVGVLLASGTSSAGIHGSAIGAIVAASLLLYAAGLLANDYFDRSIDARERPTRPIPSGAVTPRAVLGTALVLTGGGLILLLGYAGRASVTAGLLVAFASWFYNAAGKRSVVWAPLSMGLCRGLSLMMGACVMGFQSAASFGVLVSAAALTLFIALVTQLARHEAEASRPPSPAWAGWTVPLLLATWLTAVLSRSTHPLNLAFILSAMALLWSMVWIIQLKPATPQAQFQSAIGGLIRGLILTQAALCASCGPAGQALALLLLAAFPVSGWIGKWFYGS